MAKDKESTKKKVDKVAKAKKQLAVYLKENKLDPSKDYSKDKKHGEKIRELTAIIETSRGKVKESAPVEEKRSKKREKSAKATKYDYPLVDGKEMSAADKKKYRVKMRAAEKGEKPAKAKKEEKVSKKEKVVKDAGSKAKKEDKSSKKDKSKKSKRQDD